MDFWPLSLLFRKATKPLVINTWEFPEAASEGIRAIKEGGNALDAVVAGCGACERNPERTCVGKFGKTDESGEVSLDAMVMDGKSLRAGAVGCLRRIEDAVKVARAVMDHTKHTLLVGEDAGKFAKEIGFKETELKSKFSIDEHNKWLKANKQPNFREYNLPGVTPDNHDTVGVIALDCQGDLAVGLSTCGLHYKVPGRVGDTPIPGSGGYAKNGVGAAAATGDGDFMMRFCPTFHVVEKMEQGSSVGRAVEDTIKSMANFNKDFQGALIAMDKNGNFAAACNGIERFRFCIADENGQRVFERSCSNPIKGTTHIDYERPVASNKPG